MPDLGSIKLKLISQIRKEREELDLVPRSEIITLLRHKIESTSGNVPDIIRRLTEKCITDLENCSNENDLCTILAEWAKIVPTQQNEDIMMFMNGLGSILMRVKCEQT